MTGWLGINIMFPSGATRLSPDYCFSDLALWKNPTKLVDLVQSGYYYLIKCNLFSSWYRWNIDHFVLRNNHLLTPSDTILICMEEEEEEEYFIDQ